MRTLFQKWKNLKKTIESMAEKRVSGWTCKVCKKLSVRKYNIKKHTEVHIEGIKRPCLTCGKIFKSRDSLSVHRAASHSNTIQYNNKGSSRDAPEMGIKNLLKCRQNTTIDFI